MRVLQRLLLAATGVSAGAALVLAATGPAPSPYLVREINGDTTLHSQPVRFTTVGDRAFFVTGIDDDRPVLWVTDGTPAGTLRVSDVPEVRYPIAFGDVLVFGRGAELWMSDGTPGGTRLLAPLAIGRYYDESGWPLAVAGDALYAFACDPNSACGLWRIDGSSAGPVLLARTSQGDVMYAEVDMTAVGDALFFNPGHDLWRTDGTVAGTHLVARIDGESPDGYLTAPWRLTGVGSLAFFVSCDDEWCRLWRSDGTANGTIPLAVLSQSLLGEDDEDDVPDFYLHAVEVAPGYELLFAVAGEGVWSSDGTVEGTRRLADTQCYDNECGRPTTQVGDHLLFDGCLPEAGCGLLRSDGTREGTALVAGSPPRLRPLGEVGGVAYFTAGTSLWRSDGTPAGTQQVTILPSRVVYHDEYAPPPDIAVAGGRLLFQGCAGPTGCEPWRSDGTAAGTGILLDVGANPPSAGAFPHALLDVGGTLHFVAYDASGAARLWRSDGTAAGTTPFGTVTPVDGSLRAELVAVDDSLFFTRRDYVYPYSGRSLWKSDGTTDGTVRVAGPEHFRESTGYALAAAGGLLYFVNEDYGPDGLWRSDGTLAGTVRLAGVGARSVTDVGGVAFFAGTDHQRGVELWKTDGTPAGTVRVTDINPGIADSIQGNGPQVLAAGDGVVYFAAFEPASGCQLWRSDGTIAGTRRLTALPGPDCPWRLTPLGNEVFFMRSDEVWRTDRLSAGAVRLAVGNDPFVNQRPFRIVDGGIVFSICDDTACALWQSDGSIAGTATLIGPSPELLGLRDEDVWSFGDTLVFVTSPSDGTQRLWRGDWRGIGTELLAELRNASQWTPSGRRLFFSQSEVEHGSELWAVEFDAPVPTSTTRPTTTTRTTSTTTTILTRSTTTTLSPGPCAMGCDDGDPCTRDHCEDRRGCVFTPAPDSVPCREHRRQWALACVPSRLARRLGSQLDDLAGCVADGQRRTALQRVARLYRWNIRVAVRRGQIAPECADRLRALVPAECAAGRTR